MLMMEDRSLLKAYRRGDSKALEVVYRHYAGKVERMIRSGFSFSSGGQTFRFMGFHSAFEREEAVQETFIRAFGTRAREGYSGLKPFGPYLSGITRNLIIDEFRRRRREMSLFVSEDGEARSLDTIDSALLEQSPLGEWARRGSDPESAVVKRELKALMAAFMDELDDDAKKLVQIHFMEGRSQQHAAELMNIDRNKIRKEIRLLRLRLLRFMKCRGEIESLRPEELLAATGLG